MSTPARSLSGVNHLTPDATRGLDGKSYPARKEPKPPDNDDRRETGYMETITADELAARWAATRATIAAEREVAAKEQETP